MPTRAREPKIFRTYNKPAFNTVHFGWNMFTCWWERSYMLFPSISCTCMTSVKGILVASCFYSLYRTSWSRSQFIFTSGNDDDGSFLAHENCWEGWWSILARSFMVVRTDTWCAPPTALWTMVWDEDAAPSFCLLLFSFAASCLSASNSQLAFLTDECQLSQSEAFCWHDWWLTTACTSCLFSWSL